MGERDGFILEPGANAALTMVSDQFRGGLLRYVQHGVQPGSLLCSVIENDLGGALVRADPGVTLGELRAIYLWLYNYASAACYGSREKRLNWQTSRFVATTSRENEND